MGWFVIH